MKNILSRSKMFTMILALVSVPCIGLCQLESKGKDYDLDGFEVVDMTPYEALWALNVKMKASHGAMVAVYISGRQDISGKEIRLPELISSQKRITIKLGKTTFWTAFKAIMEKKRWHWRYGRDNRIVVYPWMRIDNGGGEVEEVPDPDIKDGEPGIHELPYEFGVPEAPSNGKKNAQSRIGTDSGQSANGKAELGEVATDGGGDELNARVAANRNEMAAEYVDDFESHIESEEFAALLKKLADAAESEGLDRTFYVAGFVRGILAFRYIGGRGEPGVLRFPRGFYWGKFLAEMEGRSAGTEYGMKLQSDFVNKASEKVLKRLKQEDAAKIIEPERNPPADGSQPASKK